MRPFLILILILMLGLALSACTTGETARRVAPEMTMPPMATFKRVTTTPTKASNATIARDFLDLAFTLENGMALPIFTRFTGPVTVKVAGAANATLGPDLDRLLLRLRKEAGIDISRVTGDAPASITIVPRAKRANPQSRPDSGLFCATRCVKLGRISRAAR